MTLVWPVTFYIAASLACGLVAGVFLAFSDFLMRSLDAMRPTGAVEAMQAINRKVKPSLFVVLLLVLGVVSLSIAGHALATQEGVEAHLAVAAATIYMVGVIGVTFLRNVPMNERLALFARDDPKAVRYWSTVYRPRWTAWNHVRTLASASAALCYMIASLQVTGV